MSDVNDSATSSSEKEQHANSGVRPLIVAMGIIIVAVLVIFLIKDHRSPPHEIGPIHGIAFCPDGKRVVTGNQDGTVRLWDAASGQELRCFPVHTSGAVCAVAVTPDGLKLVADTYRLDQAHDFNHPDYGLTIWDLDSGQIVTRLFGSSGQIEAIAVCPDNVHVVAACRDRTIREWDITTGQITLSLSNHEGDINAVAVTPDGKFVVSGSGDYWGGQLHDASVRVWDRQTGKLVRTLGNLSGAVYGVSVARDGSKVASCGWDGYVRIWDFNTGQQIMQMGTGAEHFHSVVFSPNGKIVGAASGMCNGLVHFWDTTSGEEIVQAKGTYSESHCIVFSPDGQRAASSHGYYGGDGLNTFGSPLAKVVDGVVRIWNVKTGEEVLKFGSSAEENQK